jgi:hypothetical protein
VVAYLLEELGELRGMGVRKEGFDELRHLPRLRRARGEELLAEANHQEVLHLVPHHLLDGRKK